MATSKTPLVVDVDGTLLRTDLLFESFWNALGVRPFLTVWVLITTLWKRAKLKRKLAVMSHLDFKLLPLNQDVLAQIAIARDEGRAVYLASGGDQILVGRLAKTLKIADHFFASNGVSDLTAQNKAVSLVNRFGENGFSYIGDQMADLPVWAVADHAYVVGENPAVHQGVARLRKPTTTLGGGWNMLDLLRAMRIYQWVKNVLLLMPILSAQRTDLYGFMQVFLAILAFSLVASAIYIANDLFDLEADRKHPRKRERPFASGAVPIPVGMLAGVLLALLGLSMAASMGRDVFGVFIVYILLSFAYSIYLKKMPWVDIVTLAMLYTLRVIAGVAAANASLSLWLVAFVVPVFISLSAVKRVTELVRLKDAKELPGRGYTHEQAEALYKIAKISAITAMALFLIYTFSPTAISLYDGLWELRWCAIPVSAWLYHMITTARDGRQNYDPITFAMRDKISLVLVGLTVLGLYNAAARPLFSAL